MDDGHEVRLIGCRLPNTYEDESSLGRVAVINVGYFEYLSVSGEVIEDTNFLQDQV